ncbi:MAG: single-stranded DNA-binding protein [Kiritimatiellae bacterium]|nr:single-stranded DNA-binding protein [Kiritimatiellia bacterium]
MASLNRVLLIGNLTRDPEVRYIPSGTAVAELGLAVNESFRNKEGQEVESTVFVDVVVWARQAETCAEYLSKGSPVFIEGRLQLDQWESKEGEKRSKIRVRADRVQFLGSPRRGAEFADGGGGEGDQAAAPAAQQGEPVSNAPDAQPQGQAAVAPNPPSDTVKTDDDLPF